MVSFSTSNILWSPLKLKLQYNSLHLAPKFSYLHFINWIKFETHRTKSTDTSGAMHCHCMLHWVKLCNILQPGWPAGHAGVPVHAAARLPLPEAQLDLPPVRPQRWRHHHQDRDGQRGGRRVRAARHRVRHAGEYWIYNTVWMNGQVSSFYHASLASETNKNGPTFQLKSLAEPFIR